MWNGLTTGLSGALQSLDQVSLPQLVVPLHVWECRVWARLVSAERRVHSALAEAAAGTWMVRIL